MYLYMYISVIYILYRFKSVHLTASFTVYIMSAILKIYYTYTYTEHPYRTRMPLQDEPYTEQVIILPSQGIWYERPEPIVNILAKTNLTGITHH